MKLTPITVAGNNNKVFQITHGDRRYRYLAEHDHWESSGMKTVMSITFKKGGREVYYWGPIPGENYQDITKYPYAESAYRCSSFGNPMDDFDEIEVATSK